MSIVEIYTVMLCPFCDRAKKLLQAKGADFTEIDVTFDADGRETMMRRAAGRYTVPQIFIDGQSIGGSEELAALDREGRLDALLGIGP